jgi:mono/diheme cytochrome c family protein
MKLKSLRNLFCAVLLASSLAACWTYRGEFLALPPAEPEIIERGQKLVNGLGSCGFCHGVTGQPGAALTGGREFYDRYGAAPATNITPHQTGVGNWTTRDFVNLFRRSISKNGELSSVEFHSGSDWIADRDLFAIVAYLGSLQPLPSSVERRNINWFERNFEGFWESRPELTGYVPEVSYGSPVAYGRYLTDHVARCGSCHTGLPGWFSDPPYLRGKTITMINGEEHRAPRLVGKKYASSWPEQDLINFLQTGTTPTGRRVNPNLCPVEFYAQADVEDLQSIAMYLNRLK